jgi:hypothetical protein
MRFEDCEEEFLMGMTLDEILERIAGLTLLLFPFVLWFSYIPLYAWLFVRRVVQERESRKILYWSLAMGWIIQLCLIALYIVSGILDWSSHPARHNPVLVHIGNSFPMAIFLFGAWFNAIFCYRRDRADSKRLQRDNTLVIMAIVCLAASVMAIAATRAWHDSSGPFMGLEIAALSVSLWLMVRQGRRSVLNRHLDLSLPQRLMYFASLLTCIEFCFVGATISIMFRCID